MSIETGSPTWQAIEEWAWERLTALTETLESPLTDYADTQFARGQVAALRELLNLVNADKTLAVLSDPYERVQL